ncbi:MAG TPA: polysaccharide biosynthesis tyrosine autokinase [Pyrinomonadaceae bacterium]|jgi:capsular exopolysaccharide synthesis family protein
MKDTREIIHRQVAEKVEIERPFEPQVPATNGGYGAYRDFTQSEGFQLIDYWRAIRKRLWLVIGIAVLLTTLTAIYMAHKPNIYMAKAVVQVDLEQTNPDLVTKDSRAPVVQSDPAYFNTQLQLLFSDSLLRRVVKELSLDSNKEIQQARAEESVSPWRSMLKAIGLASDEKKKEKGVGEVAPSQNSNLASTEEIAEAVRLAPYVDLIKKNLGIEPVRESRATVKDTRLIEITFRHTNPELAANVVNGIAGTFTKVNQEKRTGTSKKTNDFLEERVANLQAQVKTDEQKLVDLKQRSGIINIDANQTLVINSLAALNKQLLDAENQRKNAEAEYNAVKESPENVKSRAEELLARYITEQENQIRNFEIDTNKTIAGIEAERERLLKEFRPEAQEITELDAKIATFKLAIQQQRDKSQQELERYRNRSAQVILDNLRTKYVQAKQQEDKIRASFNDQYNQAQGQSQAAINIRLLEQNIETNKGFLKNLIEQQSGNDITAKGSDNNISVTEIAIPPDTAVSPRRLTTVLAALFLSTLFGAGLALFLEYLDDTVRSTEEVESLLQLPALAAIPTIDSMPKRRLLLVGGGNASEEEDSKPKSALLISSDSRSSLAEAYRQLRTSILLSTAGHAPKSLLVTSSLPSEGKTTTAVNTAISLAQTGAKVLIIDADMRRPRLHSIFEISNAEGLSTLLSSNLNEKEVLDVVQYDEEAKLYLLPSGPVPPNPAELIGSEQMTNLLKTMQDNFTHVVVDSPPIASFTDGVLIASMVDGVILVVHSGRSSRQVVKRSRQLLQDIGAKILGVVLNNVNLRSQDNYYYYQSYYHRSYYRNDDE